MQNIAEPIIVLGGPRSGTTLTMKLLHANGMQVGRTAEQNPLIEGNIRDKLYKPILSKGGFDKFAQRNLPPPGWMPEMSADEFRDQVHNLFGWYDPFKPWGFKAVKGLLFWPLLLKAFPDAKFVLVQRDREEHISSLLRTTFMTAHKTREGWWGYLDKIQEHERLAFCGIENMNVWYPSNVRDKKIPAIQGFVEWCGLSFSERSLGVFDKKLYRKFAK